MSAPRSTARIAPSRRRRPPPSAPLPAPAGRAAPRRAAPAQPGADATCCSATRDTANGRKTAKKILGGVAMVGGVALLFIPGGGVVSAAVFTVTAAAGAASVGVEIEDRIAKEGELKFDRRL